MKYIQKVNFFLRRAVLATCYLLLATCYLLLPTCYLLFATCYFLIATCHLLLASCFLLLSTHYFLLATSYFGWGLVHYSFCGWVGRHAKSRDPGILDPGQFWSKIRDSEI